MILLNCPHNLRDIFFLKSWKDFISVYIFVIWLEPMPSLIHLIYTLQKKITHNILVYRQVQIIVAVTCVLYTSYVIEYNE